MARGAKLTAVSYIDIDGEPILWDSLSKEKKEEYIQKIAENIGKTLSWYFGEHPDELASLKKHFVAEETETKITRENRLS